MREAFTTATFYSSTLELIRQANIICAEYAAQGYTLTLRQLYYKFVSRDLLENSVKSYKKLGSAISNGRLAGLIDWDSIEDRGRWLHQIPNYNSPSDFISSVVHGYAEDLWRDQETYCEVWVEKDALAGVVARSCNAWRIPYFPCKGYGSQSELYSAGKRLADRSEHIVILHLGDHDPSGLDMTRDNRERLSMFAGQDIEIRRLALNMDQIEQYDPPANPAKETDTRFADYEKQYGSESWELDALEPAVINDLIETEVLKFLDLDLFREYEAEESKNRELLKLAARNWNKVVKTLHKSGQG